MTVTEIDHVAVKERIIKILKSKTTLWEEQGHGAGFRSIEIGLPDNQTWLGQNYPVCYVTNHEDFERDKPYGPVEGTEIGSSEHIVKYKIIFLDQKKSGQETEKSLDAYHKIIKEALKTYNALQDPDDPTNPAKELATDSYPVRTVSLSAQMNGQPVDGRIIELWCKIHTS